MHIDPSALVTLGRCMCGFDQMLPADLLETHLRLKEQHQGPEPDGAPRIGAQLTSNPVSPHFNSHSTASTRPASPSAEVTVFKALGDLYYNNDTAPVAHAVRQARTHAHTHSARDTSLAAPGLVSPAPAGAAASKRGVEGQLRSSTSAPHVSLSPSRSMARPMPPLNLTSLASSCQLGDHTPRSFTSSSSNPVAVAPQPRGLSPRAVQGAGVDREKWRTERREQRAKMHIIKSNRASSKVQEALQQQQQALQQTLKVSVCAEKSTPSNPSRGCYLCFYSTYEYYTSVHMSTTLLNLYNVPPHFLTSPLSTTPSFPSPPPPPLR